MDFNPLLIVLKTLQRQLELLSQFVVQLGRRSHPFQGFQDFRVSSVLTVRRL